LITIIFNLLIYLVQLLIWAVVLQIIVSWLLAFNVLDSRNRIVWTINDFLYRVTDPFLRPIRRRMPNLGNIDISPFILIIVLRLLVIPLLVWVEFGILTGNWTL
jgi:YggT family protein